MKIFGIGLSRTGTTTLTKALNILGYSCVHYPHTLDEIEHYDAATDAPVAIAFKELDQKYPGSKFILTTRDVNSWLKSIEWLFNFHANLDRMQEGYRQLVSANRMKTYGTDNYDQTKLLATYRKHTTDVFTYFNNRSDLLVFDVCTGDGWEKLCLFLGKPIPNESFPNLNAKN